VTVSGVSQGNGSRPYVTSDHQAVAQALQTRIGIWCSTTFAMAWLSGGPRRDNRAHKHRRVSSQFYTNLVTSFMQSCAPGKREIGAGWIFGAAESDQQETLFRFVRGGRGRCNCG